MEGGLARVGAVMVAFVVVLCVAVVLLWSIAHPGRTDGPPYLSQRDLATVRSTGLDVRSTTTRVSADDAEQALEARAWDGEVEGVARATVVLPESRREREVWLLLIADVPVGKRGTQVSDQVVALDADDLTVVFTARVR